MDRYPITGETRPAAPKIGLCDRVHDQVLRKTSRLTETELEQEVLHPHPNAKTKLASLLWCANHEMMHAGQIGLLRRRELGHAPL